MIFDTRRMTFAEKREDRWDTQQGLGLSGYFRSKERIRRFGESDEGAWLTYCGEQGAGFHFRIGEVPARMQRDDRPIETRAGEQRHLGEVAASIGEDTGGWSWTSLYFRFESRMRAGKCLGVDFVQFSSSEEDVVIQRWALVDDRGNAHDAPVMPVVPSPPVNNPGAAPFSLRDTNASDEDGEV